MRLCYLFMRKKVGDMIKHDIKSLSSGGCVRRRTKWVRRGTGLVYLQKKEVLRDNS